MQILHSCCCYNLISEDGLCISDDTVNAEWKTKSVKHWESHDIMCWIISVANENDRKSEDICISQFNNIDGKCLLNMSKADFVSLEPQHGEFLYSTLQQLMQEQEQVDSLTKCELFGQSACNEYINIVCQILF